MIYRFEGFELDDQLFELRRSGALVAIKGRAFDLLVTLIRRRAGVVAKDDLVATVWSGAAVTKDALPQAIMIARRALDDDVDSPRFIHTVRGRGYRFVADVQAIDETVAVSDPRASLGGRPKIREAELSLLDSAFARAASGYGNFVALSGDAGVGKTWLIEQVRNVGHPARPVVVRAEPGDGAPDAWTFIKALRVINPELSLCLAQAKLDDARERFRIFDRIAVALCERSNAPPTLLAIDDLHLTDARSLELLYFLTRRLPAAPMLLVVAYRPGVWRHPSFEATVGALSRESHVSVVRVEPFTPDESLIYLEQALGRAPPEALLSKIFEKTMGNALLLSQLVHVLEAEERLRRDAVATSTLAGGDRMRETIVHLLASLPSTTVGVLTAAAVLGRRFALTPLAAVLGTTNAAVLLDLDAANACRIVAPAKGGAYVFTYPLVRDVLYKRMPVSERVRLHGAAATALIEQRGDNGERESIMEIAGHLVDAAPGGDINAAIDWSLRAAAAASAAGDDEAAVRWAERGLGAMRFAQQPDGEKEMRLRAILETHRSAS